MSEELTLTPAASSPAADASQTTGTTAAAPDNNSFTGSGLSSAPASGVDAPTSDAPVDKGADGAASDQQAGDADKLDRFDKHPRWIERENRIKELETQAKEREGWDEIIADFKAQGMTTAEAVRATQAQRADEAELSGIAQRLLRDVEDGRLTEDAAEERFARIQTQREADKTAAELHRLKVRDSLPALAKAFPEADLAEVEEAALAQGAKADLTRLLQKSHDRAMVAISRHVARQAAQPQTPVEGDGGTVRTTKTVAEMTSDEFDAHWAAELAKGAKLRPGV